MKSTHFIVLTNMFRNEVGSNYSFRSSKNTSFWLERLSDPALLSWDIFKKIQHNLWSLSHLEPTSFLNTLGFDFRSFNTPLKLIFSFNFTIWLMAGSEKVPDWKCLFKLRTMIWEMHFIILWAQTLTRLFLSLQLSAS